MAIILDPQVLSFCRFYALNFFSDFGDFLTLCVRKKSMEKALHAN